MLSILTALGVSTSPELLKFISIKKRVLKDDTLNISEEYLTCVSGKSNSVVKKKRNIVVKKSNEATDSGNNKSVKLIEFFQDSWSRTSSSSESHSKTNPNANPD